MQEREGEKRKEKIKLRDNLGKSRGVKSDN